MRGAGDATPPWEPRTSPWRCSWRGGKAAGGRGQHRRSFGARGGRPGLALPSLWERHPARRSAALQSGGGYGDRGTTMTSGRAPDIHARTPPQHPARGGTSQLVWPTMNSVLPPEVKKKPPTNKSEPRLGVPGFGAAPMTAAGAAP